MFCPNCGRKNDDAARFCQSCGEELTQQVRESVAVSYAGFWKRFAALLIDTIVVSAASGILTAVTFGATWFAIFLLPWVYEAIMLSSEKQATVGKMVLGIIVTDLATVYRNEAHARDQLLFEVGVMDFNKYGGDIIFRITRPADGALIAMAKSGFVFFDYAGKTVVPMPAGFAGRFPKVNWVPKLA